MPSRRTRAGAAVTGGRETLAIAATLGGIVREARRSRRWTLSEVARRIGISVARLSEIERGLGARAPLETWVALGVALERPLAVSLSKPLAAARVGLGDGHLEIQEHILRLARETGRQGTFELPTRPADPSRSTDVGIRDARLHVRILVECWNSIGDLGGAVRATRRKETEATATWPDDRIATVWVVRDTAANRTLLARYPSIVDAAFPGSSRRWVRVLTQGDVPPPDEPGLVWFDPTTATIREHRRARMQP
jgi:transcriptional regulator with XRE-family HTH domain